MYDQHNKIIENALMEVGASFEVYGSDRDKFFQVMSNDGLFFGIRFDGGNTPISTLKSRQASLEWRQIHSDQLID